jgi:hypothetical protein
MTKRTGIRILGTVALFVGLLAVSGGTAHAVSGYLSSFNTQYGTASTRLNSCTLCHPSVPSLNAYGTAYAGAGHGFAAIESADSDGDGFTNIAEIRALAFPGNAADKPAPAAGTPALTVAPTADAFGNVTVGLASAPVVNTLTNSGTAAVSVTGMTLSDTADYTMDVNGGASPCGATSTTLAPGAFCTFAVRFAPKTAGSLPGTLTVASNDPAGSDVVSLTGTGVAAAVPKAAVTPNSVAFGSVAVGGASAPVVNTIANTGTAPLSISGMTLSNATDFSLDLNGGGAPCATAAKTLAAGASCTVSTRFNPKSAGAKAASLTVASNDPAAPNASVALAGTGATAAAPRISATPASVAAGTVTVGASSAPQTVTVSNTGSANLAIGTLSIAGANQAEFGLQGDRCSSQTLAPAATCTVQVVFTPASAGAKSATLSIPSGDSATPNLGVPVSGSGAAQANVPPTVVSTSPVAGASNVPVSSTVTAQFSETMNASSITASTFTLSANGSAIAGTVSVSGTTATFTPSAPLAAGILHTATVTTGVRDLGGAGLAANRSWTFTTVSPVDDTDSDGDGVLDDDDDFPHDNRKATPHPNHGRGKIGIDVSSILGAYLTEVHSESEMMHEGRPAGFRFDDGLLSFKINRGSGVAMLTLTFPDTIPAGSRVFMVTHDGYRAIPGAAISGNTVTIPVTQGVAEGVSSPALTMGGTGTATANLVGVGSPDAAASASSGGGCSAAGGTSGFDGIAGLLLGAAGLLLRRRFARSRS